MYARVLRKCSLAKFLMNLWLVVIMLLVICCQNATAMHLIRNARPSRSSISLLTSSANSMPGRLDLGSTMTIYHPFDPYMTPYYLRQSQGARYVQPTKDLLNTQFGDTMQQQQLKPSEQRDHLQYYSPYTVFVKTNADRAELSNPVPNINSQIINLNRDNYASSSTYDSQHLLQDSALKRAQNLETKTQSNQKQNILQRARLTSSSGISYFDKSSETAQQPMEPTEGDRAPIQSKDTNIVTLPLRFLPSASQPSSQLQSQPYAFNHFRPSANFQAESERRLRINRHRKRRHHHFEQGVLTDQISDSQKLDHKNSNKSSKSSSFSTITTTFSHYNNKIKENTTDSLSSKKFDPRLKRGNRNESNPFVDPQDQQQVASRLVNNRYQRSSRSYHPRRRPKRYCSARDPIQLAYLAPIVLEGKVRSMSTDRQVNFSVSFEVTLIFKNRQNHKIRKLDLVRLQFTLLNTSGECDIYQEQFRESGLIQRDLQNGRNYTLFLQYVGEKFRILGQPILSNQDVYNSVKTASQEKFGKTASIKMLTANKQGKVREKDELRIVCKVRGNPPPKITWFKDDKSIKQNRRLYQFINSKRKSDLIVKSFSNATAGLYECRAKNMVSKKVEKKTIRVEAYGRPDSHNDTGEDCVTSMKAYCLNGGICRFFSDISQYYCKCAEGFEGDRCQEKRPTNVSLNQTVTGYMADSPTDTMSDESDENISLSDE